MKIPKLVRPVKVDFGSGPMAAPIPRAPGMRKSMNLVTLTDKIITPADERLGLVVGDRRWPKDALAPDGEVVDFGDASTRRYFTRLASKGVVTISEPPKDTPAKRAGKAVAEG